MSLARSPPPVHRPEELETWTPFLKVSQIYHMKPNTLLKESRYKSCCCCTCKALLDGVFLPTSPLWIFVETRMINRIGLIRIGRTSNSSLFPDNHTFFAEVSRIVYREPKAECVNIGRFPFNLSTCCSVQCYPSLSGVLRFSAYLATILEVYSDPPLLATCPHLSSVCFLPVNFSLSSLMY